MSTATKTRLDVVPLTRHIGAEIRGIDLREKPDDETVKAIYQAWLDHLVIMFPGPEAVAGGSHPRHRLFRRAGRCPRPPKYFPKGYSSLLPGIMMISNIRENGEPIGALPDGEMMFHHDMIHAEMPSKAHAALFGRDPVDRRQHAVRQRLRRLRHARSRRSATSSKAAGRSTITITARWSRATPRAPRPSARCTHPVFRTHEDTGTQGGLRQPPDDGRRRRHAAGGGRAAARSGVRPRREAGIRLRARLAARRPAAVGQPLLVARAHAISPRPSGG